MESIPLGLGVRKIGDISILDVAGEIDVYTAPRFKEAVSEILEAGQKNLLINMAGVTYMDSSGFGTLLSATKKLRPEGGSVNLISCSASIDRILKITRLDTIFGTYRDDDEAVQAMHSKVYDGKGQ